MTNTSRTLFFVGLASALSGQVVVAQTTGDSGANRLEEVMVTAQRRSQNLQEVPVAVTSFTNRQLEAAQIREAGDLVRFVPSLTGGINVGTGGAISFFMRGLGSTEQVATFDVPVALYVDEIYIARQSVNNVSMFDVERVEVLRGPQGTLFGRNSTGGAVSISMAKPGNELGGFVEAGVGSWGRQTIRGSLDIPVSDTVLTKFSGFILEDDGYARSTTLDERVNSEKNWGVRAATTVMLNDRVTWDLSYDYIDSDRTTLGFLPFDPEYRTRTGLALTDCDSSIIDTFLNEQQGNCSNIRTGGITSNLNWEMDWATLNVITGYRHTDQSFALDFQIGPNTAGPLGGFMIANEVDHDQFTQEFKLVGNTDRLSWVAGAFYLYEDSTTDALDSFGFATAFPLGLLLGHKRLENETDSLAFYLQGDYRLTDSLELTLGGRYTDETKEVDFTSLIRNSYPASFIPAFAPPDLLPTSANMVAAGIPLKQDETQFSPRVALTYTMNDDLLFFASATNGFKSGGWNARANSAPLNSDFGPEEAWSYEVGMKSEWLDGNLRLNLTGYFLEVEDLQVLSGFESPTGIEFLTQNAADLEAMGLEFEIAYAPLANLEFFINGSVSDGGEYKNIPPLLGAGGVPCSATPEPLNCTTEDDDPVRFPEQQVNAGVSYSVPVGAGELVFNGALSYQSSYWSSTYNDLGTVTGVPVGSDTPVTADFSETGDTTMVNIGATYAAPSEQWTATLECQNCSNEYFFTSSLAGTGYPVLPRWVNFRVRYNF